MTSKRVERAFLTFIKVVRFVLYSFVLVNGIYLVVVGPQVVARIVGVFCAALGGQMLLFYWKAGYWRRSR